MPVCELCGSEGKVKLVSIQGMGSKNLCEACRARLQTAYPSQRPQIAREIAATRQRSLTK